MLLRTDLNVKFRDSKNTPKLNAFFCSLSMNFSTSKWWVEKCFQLIKNTPIPNNAREFKVKKEIHSNFPQTKHKSFQFQTTSLNGNFQTLNTKVCFDEEILKLLMHQNWTQKERSHNSTNECKAQSKTNWLRKN